MQWDVAKTKIRAPTLVFPLLFSIFLAACGGGTSDGSSSGSGASSGTFGSSSASSSNGSSSGSSGTPATGSLALSWDAVTDSRVTGYKIYYSQAPFSSSTTPRTITVGNTTSHQFVPSGVSAGATVYIAVAALGTGLESPLSNSVSIVAQ